MPAYYNEIDPQAAQWLRNLIAAGHIAPGDVDERSIWDVHPGDLEPYVQCHFFAGIGIWSDALRRAGWPDDRPVWTGSCPCQPFSASGKGRGFADERHLWPAWWHLISKRRPGVVFGEQVEGHDGKAWLDLVQADLERGGYAVGPVVLPAAGFGAPHGRHRFYFVAEPGEQRREGKRLHLRQRGSLPTVPQVAGSREAGELGDARGAGLAIGPGPEDGRGAVRHEGAPAAAAGVDGGKPGRSLGSDAENQGAAWGFWSGAEWIACSDGRARAVEPGTFPLAHGAPARVVRLRAYGNAIVAPVAEEFIRAYMTD